MSSTEFDSRLKSVEGRLDEAQNLLDSIGRVVRGIEQARESAERGKLVPLVVLVASAVVATTALVVARHHQAV